MSASSRPTRLPELRLDSVRELLRAYHREVKSSVLRFDRPSVLVTINKMAPVQEMGILYRANDPVVRELGSWFWIVVKDLDLGPFLPMLLDDLEAKDPRRRAVAAEGLGYIDDPQYLPHLRAHAKDNQEVPGYTEGTVVADFVEVAIKRIEATGRR